MYNKNYKLEFYHKISFTIFVILLYKIFSYIPILGIDVNCFFTFSQKTNFIGKNMLHILTGGYFSNISILTINIMPYITASIVMQLFSVFISREQNKNFYIDKKHKGMIIKFLTLVFALCQSIIVVYNLKYKILYTNYIILLPLCLFQIFAVLIFIIGTMFLFWLSEQVTLYGCCNGISLIIFMNVVFLFSKNLVFLFFFYKNFLNKIICIFLCLLCLVLLVVVFEVSQRKVFIEYPQRHLFYSKLHQLDFGYVPLKINNAGIIPPVFSILILNFVVGICSSYSFILRFYNYLYYILYIFCIVLFSFCYTLLSVDMTNISVSLQKSGAYIPGVRPGINTAKYLKYILLYLTCLSSCYLCIVCVVLEACFSKVFVFGDFSITGIYILIGVILDMISGIHTNFLGIKYDNILQKIKLNK